MSATSELARRLLDSAGDDEAQAVAGVGFALLAIYELLDDEAFHRANRRPSDG